MDFLEFENDGRTLTCRSASSPATPGTTWWWLNVSGDSQRYAAFRTEPGDTPRNVRSRMLAWHLQLLADRDRPRDIRTPWWKRSVSTNAAADVAAESPK